MSLGGFLLKHVRTIVCQLFQRNLESKNCLDTNTFDPQFLKFISFFTPLFTTLTLSHVWVWKTLMSLGGFILKHVRTIVCQLFHRNLESKNCLDTNTFDPPFFNPYCFLHHCSPPSLCHLGGVVLTWLSTNTTKINFIVGNLNRSIQIMQ